MPEQNETPCTEHPDNGSACPLAHIPPAVWEQVLMRLRPKPWYKRHPLLIFFGIVLLLLCLYAASDKEEEGIEVSGEALGLVSITGTIGDMQDQLKWIRKLEHAKEIKGVLLRVDSPGGGASASQELYHALARLGLKKPLVVSMGATAASGGLMISMAGERIYANGSTITGSIGVRMDIPQLKGLLDKLGLTQETLVTGPFKDAASVVRPLSEEERDYLMGILNDLHGQFVDIIVERRNLSPEQVRALATGRIFTGREALALGLIDALGGQEEAHAWLAQKTGIRQEKKLVTKPRKSKWVDDVLTSLLKLDLTETCSGLLGKTLSPPAYQLP